MNFFTVGFLLANFQLNAGWTVGYLIKLVGAFFILGGIAELGGFEQKILPTRFLCAMLIMLCGASAGTMYFCEDTSTVVARACCVLDAMATTGIAAAIYRYLFRLLKDEPELIGDEPLVRRCSTGYDRMLAVMAAALIADCVNRFTSGTAADAAGVVMAVARIVSYVMLLVGTFGFNRLRVRFNNAHPIE